MLLEEDTNNPQICEKQEMATVIKFPNIDMSSPGKTDI